MCHAGEPFLASSVPFSETQRKPYSTHRGAFERTLRLRRCPMLCDVYEPSAPDFTWRTLDSTGQPELHKKLHRF